MPNQETAATPVPFKKTEVKYAVVADDTDAASKLLSLVEPSTVEREIWFFDTAGRDLFAQGLILRARKTVRGSEPNDVTVKLRGDRVAAVGPERLTVVEGEAKLEGDQGGTAEARPSYSHTVERDGKVIDAVANGGAALETLFSSEQRNFLAEFMHDVTFAALAPRGPVPARVWDLDDGVFPHKLTAELWRVAERPLLEISHKVDSGKAPDFATKLVTFLGEENGVRFDPISKTEFVLERFGASAPGAAAS